MEGSLQEEVQKKMGLGRVKIVRLENTQMGSLGLSGYDEDGVEYKQLPSPKDSNLVVTAWMGREGTAEMNKREGIMNFRSLAGSELSQKGVLVGPAVHYSPEARVDERGAALWKRAV